MRTIYRDVDALAAAGVPVFAEPGRNGGIRLLDGYRMPPPRGFDAEQARAVVVAGLPAIAKQVGLDADIAGIAHTGDAARHVRERLLIESEPWWGPKDANQFLPDVARGVWSQQRVRLGYGARTRVVRPLGLVLKGGTWYLVARDNSDRDRLYRMSRVTEATVLAHPFDRPHDFDLVTVWETRKREFARSIPTYWVTARVAPEAEPLLHLLQEGTPALPLSADMPRDDDGWAVLRLRFERPESASRLLLQLGPAVEVLEPAELRRLMTDAAAALAALYLTPSSGGSRPRRRRPRSRAGSRASPS